MWEDWGVTVLSICTTIFRVYWLTYLGYHAEWKGVYGNI